MRWLVVLAVVLAGCGADVPALPDGLVLQARQLVGMPSPRPAELPEFSLYGDGTVIRPGPPAGALQTAEKVHIGQERAMNFYQEAHDAGLDRDQEIRNDSVVDGYAQVFVLSSRGKRFVTKATNPEGELAEFHSRLHVDGAATPYQPAKIAAVGWAPDSSQNAEQWPFAPLDQRVDAGFCVTLDAAGVAEFARKVPKGTRFRSGGTTFVVVFRPLLPGESGCGDV
ncbi:hypothetical protein UK23_41430 [Lentzea aerocolonigenes]|uniref:Uncharacterized protein n=1 Tax=Lentzea aerocolonigenes TaxID=68170 RepID=A0A0F0GE28_LENAE|nr:hypothetical protein [Lentzea aerocolonigenes]KJK38100.1 hypothetical protein UK23_41430 [Lentzea aerocolonigenes]